MVPVMEQFCWTKFRAMEQKRTLQIVKSVTGAVTTVATVKTCQLYALQRDWLEAQVHEKDVLKCIMTAGGEPCAIIIIIILMTQQQELFATCSDIATDRTLVTATVSAVEGFGWKTFVAVEQKRTLQTVHTAAGALTTVDTVWQFQFHATIQ